MKDRSEAEMEGKHGPRGYARDDIDRRNVLPNRDANTNGQHRQQAPELPYAHPLDNALLQPIGFECRCTSVARHARSPLATRTAPSQLGRSEEHTSELQSLMRTSYA